LHCISRRLTVEVNICNAYKGVLLKVLGIFYPMFHVLLKRSIWGGIPCGGYFIFIIQGKSVCLA
jgi:hypothetical protein